MTFDTAQPREWRVGDRVRLTILREGRVYEGEVEQVDKAGRVLVSVDNGLRAYRVLPGQTSFLEPAGGEAA